MPEHEADRTLLIEAARDAAQVALRHFGASPQVWQKSGGQGPVSAAQSFRPLTVNFQVSKAKFLAKSNL